jgi:hypothetical protein
MAQVDVFRDKPAGNAGELVQPVIAPPLLVGVAAAIATFLANMKGEPE